MALGSKLRPMDGLNNVLDDVKFKGEDLDEF